MCSTKSQKLWKLPILPASCLLGSRQTRKSTGKMGQYVGMVNPLLNIALHLLPEMPL